PGLNPNGRAGKWGNAGGKSNRAGCLRERRLFYRQKLQLSLRSPAFKPTGCARLAHRDARKPPEGQLYTWETFERAVQIVVKSGAPSQGRVHNGKPHVNVRNVP